MAVKGEAFIQITPDNVSSADFSFYRKGERVTRRLFTAFGDIGEEKRVELVQVRIYDTPRPEVDKIRIKEVGPVEVNDDFPIGNLPQFAGPRIGLSPEGELVDDRTRMGRFVRRSSLEARLASLVAHE